MKASLTLPALRDEYFKRFGVCEPLSARVDEIDAMIARILAARTRYEDVARKLAQTPWYVIALLHMREADLDFGCHLHNGDSLKHRTVNVPANRPTTGTGPFTWAESAWDAIRYDGLDRMDYSDVAGIAFAFEKFNGWGYRSHSLPSPYLWGAGNLQRPGKFVADGKFSLTTTDRQLGTMTVLKRMTASGALALQGVRILSV